MSSGTFTAKLEFFYSIDPINVGLIALNAASTQVQGPLQTATITRGHQFRWDPFQPGTATFTFDDTDFGFDPVSIPTLAPMMPVRFSITDPTTGFEVTMFVGFVQPRDGFAFHFDQNSGTTTVQCYDLLGYLATRTINTGGLTYDSFKNIDLIRQVDIDHRNNGGTRILPIWANSLPGLTQGVTQLGGVSPDGMDFLSFTQKVSQSEGGAFYVKADGQLACDGRQSWYQNTRQNTSQASFDVSGVAGPGPDFRTGYDMAFAQVFTSCAVTTANNPDVTYSYTSGDAAYGDQPFPAITGSWVTDSAEANALAERLVLTSQPLYFPSQFTISPRRRSTMIATAQNLELRDQVTVSTESSAGLTAYPCHIESINHQFDFRNNSWVAKYGLSSRDQLLVAQPDSSHLMILDDATTGKLDGTRQLLS